MLSARAPKRWDRPTDRVRSGDLQDAASNDVLESRPRRATQLTGDGGVPSCSYVSRIATFPLLTPDEEVSLARRAAAGDARARRRLIESNLRLVVKYARAYGGCGLSLPDLIQEGNIGLIRAAERFDFRHGARFSTWATFWIRRHLQRAVVTQARVIRLPEDVEVAINRMLHARRRLLQETGREPTEAEMAVELETTPAKVRRLQEFSGIVLSLDAPVNGDDLYLLDVITDDETPSVVNEVFTSILRAEIRGALRVLNQRERNILELRFGLRDDRQLTYREIGAEVGLSGERIKQLLSAALSKLRSAEEWNSWMAELS